ncbi:MAG TPA: hypothetical protein VH253_19205 [Phycisphaerae bacterium]|nr:hypothetical protein [Phycisphaerae bacterium]
MSELHATPTDAAAAADKEVLKNKAVAAKEAIGDLAGEATHYAKHRAQDARETAAGWVASGKEKLGDAGEATVDYIQRNPYKALAIAAGIGFVAGLILKRR